MSKRFVAACALWWLSFPVVSAAQERVLYYNDFETPNVAIEIDCGNSLDQSGINALYGRPEFTFAQDYTVEAVVLYDPAGLYKNQSPENGEYAIGMLSDVQDDQLALTFDAGGMPAVQVALDLSAINVQGCGGPFMLAAPVMKIALLDSPQGVTDWSRDALDTKTVMGTSGADDWSFRWTRGMLLLDASHATDGHVTLLFDLIAGGYAAIDNLKISAVAPQGVADQDADGVPDASDNCPAEKNADQSNADDDAAGDVCDPAPADPSRCGDRSGDGADDCAGYCDAPAHDPVCGSRPVVAAMEDGGLEAADADTPARPAADAAVAVQAQAQAQAIAAQEEGSDAAGAASGEVPRAPVVKSGCSALGVAGSRELPPWPGIILLVAAADRVRRTRRRARAGDEGSRSAQ